MMDKTADIVCHAFLSSCGPEQQQAYLRFLPPEQRKWIQELPARWKNPKNQFELPQELLDQVHYSWITPLMRALSEKEIRLFLSALTPEQIQGLKEQLLFANHLPSLPSLARDYLKKTLFEQLSEPDLLPPSCLPDDPLNALLDCDLPLLLTLIDRLSMHDLACEMRHIIDTVKLKKIHSLLSPANQAYLNSLSHKKEPVAFKKIGLNYWNKDTEALRIILTQRGINRLAKALYCKDPSLLWYVSHRLSSEMGQLLCKLCTPLDHPGAAQLLADQIVGIYTNTLQPPNPA